MLLPLTLFTDTVTVEKYLGSGGYDDVFDEPRQWPARISYGNKLVRNSDGQEVVSSSRLLLPPEANEYVNLGARVTLPLDTSTRRIVSGGPVMGLRDLSHLQYDAE